MQNLVELNHEELADIENMSDAVITSFAKRGHENFGFNDDSVRTLGQYLASDSGKYTEAQRQQLTAVYGAFLGQAIAKKTNGRWVHVAGFGVAVKTGCGELAFPFNKVMKNMENGEEDSIYALYVKY